MKIDISELRQTIRTMTRKSLLYKALKEELLSLGYWRNKPRGNPSAGLEAQQRALSQG